MKNQLKKMATALFALVSVLVYSTLVYADPTAAPAPASDDAVINKVLKGPRFILALLEGFVIAVGGIFLLYGIYSFAMAFKERETSMYGQALQTIAAGAILASAGVISALLL